ncbi:MAG: hypothetical protein M1837_002930 [Sclerophora amabilis]|nr:MAG: hypothetical protein M1837_002930 [Sclerophora amabilis]
MGVDARKPPLPAGTDTSTATDLATDLSRRTDRTSYSIPDDGSPVTISTKRKKDGSDREGATALSRAAHQSQTSLLIEYFEGGKGDTKVHSRPSVRVKVTPSTARKIKDTNDHIQITETGRSRQPSYTKRISIPPSAPRDKSLVESGDERSLSSYASATEESNLTSRAPPVEIEVMRKDSSPLLPINSPRDTRYVQPNPSEISSMPPDSLLEQRPTIQTPTQDRSRSFSREEIVHTSDTLKTPSRRRSRSLSKERLTQKVIEKLGSKPAETSSKQKHRRSSGSRSVSKDHGEHVRSSRRRSSKSHRDDDLTSGAESSLLTTSQLSGSRRSGDQYSIRSGTSKSSINNPKLLETVEDAIRRLILPEIDALKNEHQTQRHHRTRSGKESLVSGSSLSQEETGRRISKMSSAPDMINKPKVVLNQDEEGRGVVLSGDSIKGRKQRKSSRELTDSPSSKRYDRKVSDETVVAETTPKKRSKDGRGLKDAAAVGMAGALTAAALRHHDSNSSVERKERRRTRSKSRSRSASILESLESPSNRDIPPMPLSSEIHSSELTRQSILTAQTERPHSATSQGRDTPSRELTSSPSRTPTKTPTALKGALGTHHSNMSRGDLSLHSAQSDNSIREMSRADHDASRGIGAGVTGAARGGTVGSLKHHARIDEYDSIAEHDYVTRRNGGLSPIQSVASYKEELTVEPSYRHSHSTGSLSTLNEGHRQRHSGVSVNSVSSSPDRGFARSRRVDRASHGPDDASFNQDLPLESDVVYDRQESKDADIEYWHEQHKENDRNRSFNERMRADQKDSLADMKHMTNYTEDSADGAYFDEVAAGQHVMGIGANPEYRQTPTAVSSAVASLHDPSIVDFRSTRSGHSRVDDQSYSDSLTDYHQEGDHEPLHPQRSIPFSQRSSPTKPVSYDNRRDEMVHERSQPQSYSGSPQRSLNRSTSDHVDSIRMGTSGLPDLNDPMPAIGHVPDDESDMTTNPSIIQGPIGGVHHDNRDHWPYEPTPPQSNGNLLAGQGAHEDHGGVNAAEAGTLGAAAGAGVQAAIGNNTPDRGDFGYDKDIGFDGDLKKQAHVDDEYDRALNHDFAQMNDTFVSSNVHQSPLLKDEGYISAANARSPGAITPEPRQKGLDFLGNDGMGGIDDVMAGDDVFKSSKHTRNISGNSHGMPSPLYDSAMGRGLDKIHSKDVVALMDLLTVRDAQRNARDTEILVTLVRSAAEMRNSFEDMKKLLAEQENYIVNSTDKNTERAVQKAMHGPRPQPFGGARGTRRSSTDDEAVEDMPTKRRNVFRRALKGLSTRSSNDLAHIENMLNQLLGDVEGLKASQELQPSRTQATSLDSYDNLRTVPEGYEPEGQAGTGSTNQSGSGFFSNTSSRQTSAMRGFDGRRASEHRISTVEEGDEDLAAEDTVLGTQYTTNDQLLTPTHREVRGGSVPLDTPPQVQVPSGARSSENTPKTEKNRKHKSNSSSIFPKISRWSETTASSVAKHFGSGGRKDRDSYLDTGSQSGSEGDFWNDGQHEPRGGSDRLHSGFSTDEVQRVQENQPPSPLVTQDVQEDPKYQAHRNSLNLQHPQPRAGHRYQYQLESEAQNFNPISPSSEQWGSNSNINRFSGGSGNRHSGGAGNLSPISDREFAQEPASDNAGPPRPPKIPEESHTPKKPPKIRAVDGKPQYASPLGSGHLSAYGDEARFSGDSNPSQANGSPRSASGRVPQRKPTGPRPLSSAGSQGVGSPGTARRQRNRDTFGTSNDSEDVTF